MLFDLAALWLVVWMFKTAAMDISCAVSGKPNPRYELKKARARAAGQAAPTQPRYGTRDWFADLYGDGLRAQTEWRRRRAATKRADRDAIDADVDEAPAELTDDDAEDPAPVVHDGQVDDGHAGKWSWSCRRAGCPGKGFDFDTEADAVAAARRHQCPDTQTSPDEGVQVTGGTGRTPTQPAQSSTGDPAPEPAQPVVPTQRPAAETPTARIIPFPTTTQEDPVSSEIIGLDQSIAYAKSLAAFAGEHGQAGNEGYIGHLTASRVTGAGLQTAHDMQEAFANAQALAEAHANELEKQKSVQEAYDNVPDAGDKDFQQQGR